MLKTINGPIISPVWFNNADDVIIGKEARHIRDLYINHYYMPVRSLKVDKDNLYFCSINDVLFTKDKRVLIFYPPLKSDEEYTVPDTVKIISPRAFQYVRKLKKVNLGKNVTTIKKFAFNNSSIHEINFNDKIETIEYGAFSICHGLDHINLPPSIKKIGTDAFGDCTRLHDLIIKSKDVELQNPILRKCNCMEELEINHTLKKTDAPIGISRFFPFLRQVKTTSTEIYTACVSSRSGNTEIKDIKYKGVSLDITSKSVKLNHLWYIVTAIECGCYTHEICDPDLNIDIGYQIAFEMAYKFNDMNAKRYIGRQLENIVEAYALNNDMNRVRKLLSTASNAKLAAIQSRARIQNLSTLEKELENYNIKPLKTKGYTERPKNYVSSNHESWTNWEKIMHSSTASSAREYVVIDAETTTINTLNQERYTKPIKHIEVEGGNKNFISVDGVLFDKSMRALMLYPAGRKDKEYRIPDGVQIIFQHAFAGAKHLEKVVIPESMQHIKDMAFRNCCNLRQITLNENLKTIGARCFENCSLLSKMVFPRKLEAIGYRSLNSCDNIKGVTVESKNVHMWAYAISGIKSVETITLKCPAEKMCSSKRPRLDACQNFVEFNSQNVRIKMSKTGSANIKKIESITVGDKMIEFNELFSYNSLVPEIASMIEQSNYGECNIPTTPMQRVPVKYTIAIALYKNLNDERAGAYIHRQIKPISRNLIFCDRIVALKEILPLAKLEDINTMINLASTLYKTETKIVLERYKHNNFETKALKL